MAVYQSEGSMFDNLMRMQDEFNRYFDGRVTRYPPLNAWASDDGLVIDMEVPGFDPKDVEICVVEDRLTVSGKREAAEGSKERTYLKRERLEGGFTRSLELPFRIESDKAVAAYRNGVLRITLPKAEADKPRRIRVEAA